MPLPQLFYFLYFTRSLYVENIELSFGCSLSLSLPLSLAHQPSFIYVRYDCNYLCLAAGMPYTSRTIHTHAHEKKNTSQLLLAVDRHYMHFTLFTRIFFSLLFRAFFFFGQIIRARYLTFKQALQCLNGYKWKIENELRHFCFVNIFIPFNMTVSNPLGKILMQMKFNWPGGTSWN